MADTTTDPVLRWVSVNVLEPNAWNPNAMDSFMFEKAIESIRKFGFVDPITCRRKNPGFEIIDGEHRWLAAKQENLEKIPIFDLGEVDDDTAIQLTIVLNETRGQIDPRKLGVILKDLSSRHTKENLLNALPFTRETFDRLSGTAPSLDLSSVGTRPVIDQEKKPSAWVERIYRMPADAAEVIDSAISRIREEDPDTISEWRALELLAAEYLGS